MEKYESILRFEKYIVNEIYFKNNLNFKKSEEMSSVKLKIEPDIQIEKESMNITLNVEIFNEADKNNYPFEMKINLTGYFYTKGDEPKSFVNNAIAILYPYVRAIVSTYTANANITPLILPAINVNKLIEHQKREQE